MSLHDDMTSERATKRELSYENRFQGSLNKSRQKCTIIPRQPSKISLLADEGNTE